MKPQEHQRCSWQVLQNLTKDYCSMVPAGQSRARAKIFTQLFTTLPMRNAVLVATSLLLLAACKKNNVDPDGLVPATQDGKNTGDFLLNGTPFSPRPRITSPGNKPVGAYWGHSSRRQPYININFFREDDDGRVRSLGLSIASIKRAGTYQLKDSVTPYVVPGPQSFAIYELPYKTPSYQPHYLTGPISPGEVIITRFDTAARVVSGTFEARLREYNGSDSVRVTKGRFDCSF